MNDINNKLVNTLIILTQQGNIHWKMANTRLPMDVLEGDSVDGYAYESEVHEKRVVIFRFIFKYLDDDDLFKKGYSFRLAVFGKEGFSEMKFDDELALSTLYEIVQEKCHGVTEWINEVVESF